jgi:hypothetical protein
MLERPRVGVGELLEPIARLRVTLTFVTGVALPVSSLDDERDVVFVQSGSVLKGEGKAFPQGGPGRAHRRLGPFIFGIRLLPLNFNEQTHNSSC